MTANSEHKLNQLEINRRSAGPDADYKIGREHEMAACVVNTLAVPWNEPVDEVPEPPARGDIRDIIYDRLTRTGQDNLEMKHVEGIIGQSIRDAVEMTSVIIDDNNRMRFEDWWKAGDGSVPWQYEDAELVYGVFGYKGGGRNRWKGGGGMNHAFRTYLTNISPPPRDTTHIDPLSRATKAFNEPLRAATAVNVIKENAYVLNDTWDPNNLPKAKRLALTRAFSTLSHEKQVFEIPEEVRLSDGITSSSSLGHHTVVDKSATRGPGGVYEATKLVSPLYDPGDHNPKVRLSAIERYVDDLAQGGVFNFDFTGDVVTYPWDFQLSEQLPHLSIIDKREYGLPEPHFNREQSRDRRSRRYEKVKAGEWGTNYTNTRR